jgi:hypothetical protein
MIDPNLKQTAYFLIRTNKSIERPLYYALTLLTKTPPKLVSNKLIDEVAAYNTQLDSTVLYTPIKSHKNRFKASKEL